MNARRCTLLLATASSLVLASCAIRQPPVGADIMPERTRAKIPGSWAGPHRSGTVVPNWIRNFGDPELTALVADAVERQPAHVLEHLPRRGTERRLIDGQRRRQR